MAMAVKGSGQQQQDGGAGVKVKFIETQFISSDAASFKAVVQRLTGKSSPASSPPAAVAPSPHRPRPCRPAFGGGGEATGWAEQRRLPSYVSAAGRSNDHPLMAAPTKHEAYAAAPPRLDEMHELCDFADLLYTSAGAARRDGGFPY